MSSPYSELTEGNSIGFEVCAFLAAWQAVFLAQDTFFGTRRHYWETPPRNFGTIMTGHQKQIQDEDERVSIYQFAPGLPPPPFQLASQSNFH